MNISKLKQIKPETVFLQAKIDAALFNRAKRIVDQYGIRWRAVVEGCLESFVEEIERSEKDEKPTRNSKNKK